MKLFLQLMLALLVCFTMSAASSLPTQWQGNNHYYELSGQPSATWSDANRAASNSVFNGMVGHLATITSEAENRFLVAAFEFAMAFIGGVQQHNSAAVDQGWSWVTGEVMNYQNWDSIEPNDLGDYVEDNKEDVLVLYDQDRGGTWNDVSDQYTSHYIVEYERAPAPAALLLIVTGIGISLFFRRVR